MTDTENPLPSARRRFKPYRAYKDPGVEWLGEIPVDWSAKRLKFVAAEPIKNGIGEAGAYDDPEWPRYVRITDIAGPRELREDTFKSLPPELARKAPFKVGDLLLAAVGATFGKSYLHERDLGAVCFAGYMVRFSPGREVEPSFTAYWTESSAYWALVQSRVVQATIQNFSAAKYKELVLPLPNIAQQRAIAAFLDRETARLDALVAKKDRLIELLKEKRTTLITHAVTKGLDPRVPTKASGVEWLGEIPAHWEVVSLKRIASIRYGLGEPPQLLADGLPFVRATNVSRGRIVDADMQFVDPNDVPWLRDPILRAGDIIVVRSGAYTGDSAIIPQEYDGAIAGYDMVVRPKRVEPRFLAWALLSQYVLEAQVELESMRAAQPHLNAEEVGIISLLRPPESEQRAIAALLDWETARIDALVAKVGEAIDRLKELRTALISAAVTGKIDVREEVA